MNLFFGYRQKCGGWGGGGAFRYFRTILTSLVNNRSEKNWQKKLTETPTKLTFGTKSV